MSTRKTRSTKSNKAALLTTITYKLRWEIASYLQIQDVVNLSTLNNDMRSCICGSNVHSGEAWRMNMRTYYGVFLPESDVEKREPNSGFQKFSSLSRNKIFNWTSLFNDRVFWAQVGFTLSSNFEDGKVFGCSFASRSTSREMSMISSRFDDWDEGHKLIFDFPESFILSYEVNDHTMGTWRVINAERESAVIDRLDGHPVGPGFRFIEVKMLIAYIRRHCRCPFDPSFLWPLFFWTISHTADLKDNIEELFIHLKQSGWSYLRGVKWKKLEAHSRGWIERNSGEWIQGSDGTWEMEESERHAGSDAKRLVDSLLLAVSKAMEPSRSTER